MKPLTLYNEYVLIKNIEKDERGAILINVGWGVTHLSLPVLLRGTSKQ
jgi:hypothetical protein